MDKRAVGSLPVFIMVALAAVMVVVVAIVMLFGIQLSAELVAGIKPVVGSVGGVGPDVIANATGNAWILMAAVGILSIPGYVMLKLFLGGGGSEQEQSRRQEDRDSMPPF